MTKLMYLFLATIISCLLIFQPASAHPIDEFYQVTYITLSPTRITLQIELYTGVLAASKILPLIDLNKDNNISDYESRNYIDLFLKDVTFEIDGQPVPLSVTKIEFAKLLDLQAGVGIIHFELYTELPPNSHKIFYQNNHLPEFSTYQINALSDIKHGVKITNQERNIFQFNISLTYTIDPTAATASDIAEIPAVATNIRGGVTNGQKWLTGYLYSTELSPLFLLFALGLSTVLGGLHALTPGHGKTLVAAYLIGQRGTIKHAVVLGGIVTFTHTISVIAIGLLALLASQFIVPKLLTSWLEIMSGLLVIYLGVRLLWERWHSFKSGTNHHHSNNDTHHHHSPEVVRMSDLLTLGISGGLIPCPEALGIMLIAIGLNRILLGLGLIVAFSFGLAAVLIVIGILLVRSKSLLDRFGLTGGYWQTILPVISAAIVTLLGVGIVVKGLL